MVILDGLVEVNGEKELQRGKKLRDGDIASYNGETIKICKWLLSQLNWVILEIMKICI